MPTIHVGSRTGVGNVFMVSGVVRYEASEAYVVGGVPIAGKTTEHFGLKNLFCISGGIEGTSVSRVALSDSGTLIVFDVPAGQEWSDQTTFSAGSVTNIPFLAVGW